MSNEFPLEKMDLALFENRQGTSEFSQLKDFLSFLKLYRYPKPFRFSHVESTGPLIENLSLEKNILLHVSGSEAGAEDLDINPILEHTGNPHLMELYGRISLKHATPSEVDDETRKGAALVKSLVQENDFLFLENPEKYLGKEMLALFIKALVYKTATTGQIVVVNTRFKNNWAPHLTKRIFRDEKNLFQVDHFGQGLDKSVLNLHKPQEAEQEGILKIVNVNSVQKEQNKKAA